MNAKIIGLLAAAFFGLVAVSIFGSYVAAYNAGNRHETGIKAAYENNENILAQYGQQIAEAAQIPSMQADDLRAIFTDTLDARYGAGGSQAAMQWIQEQNPSLDQATYVQLQRLIEAGRNKFEAAQTQLIDRKRQYEQELGSFWRGTMLSWAGYPNISLNDYRIVSTSRAHNAFETGVEEPIQLR